MSFGWSALTWAALATTAVSAGAAIYSGNQTRKATNAAADQANADALAAQGEAEVQAGKIRKAAKSQQSEAVAALAASGVDVTAGTAEKIQADIAQRGEEDALTTILNGSRRGKALDYQAQVDRISGRNANTAGYINAGSSVLSSVSSSARSSGWKSSAPSYRGGSSGDGFYSNPQAGP